MKVVIAGGSGVLGRRLAIDFAEQGFEVVILTRNVRSGFDHRQVTWDGRTVGRWGVELDGAMVVNLADALVEASSAGCTSTTSSGRSASS